MKKILRTSKLRILISRDSMESKDFLTLEIHASSILLCRYLIKVAKLMSQNLNHAILLRNYLLGEAPKGEGSLTTALRNFLRNMWKEAGGVLSPKELFTVVCLRFVIWIVLLIIGTKVLQGFVDFISKTHMNFSDIFLML